MNKKKCIFCTNTACIRKGFQNGHQRWYCKTCKKKFQANKKALPSKEELFCLYVFNKQTLVELHERYHMKTTTFQKLFDEIVLPVKQHNPRPIHLVVDTTFFGDFGVIVFRDELQKEDLWWMFTHQEKASFYALGKQKLESLGYTILSVTADGLVGLPNVFNGIPFQFCHFHAKKNITKYLTRNPRTEAAQELKWIMNSLSNYHHDSFIQVIHDWKNKYSSFLKERTVHPSGRWSYTHRRLRAALRSMLRMSQYLFTYQNDTVHIPTTTGSLEGHFRHIKVRVNVHAGLSTKRKVRLIQLILLNSSVSYHPNMHEKLF